MPAGLDRTSFMNADMSAVGSKDPLTGAEQRFQHDHIGLRTARDEKYISLRCLATFADFLLRPFAIGIFSVACQQLLIAFDNSPKHIRVSAAGIIVCKKYHSFPLNRDESAHSAAGTLPTPLRRRSA